MINHETLLLNKYSQDMDVVDHALYSMKHVIEYSRHFCHTYNYGKRQIYIFIEIKTLLLIVYHVF